METKPPRRRRKASKEVPGLAARLSKARKNAKMSLLQAATDLGWSRTALRSYETGATCPTLWDLLELARIYSADATELAFGKPSEKPKSGNGEIRWVSGSDGGSVPMPGTLIAGLRGPLIAATTVAPARGMAVYRRSMPSATGGFAAVETGWGVEVMWIWREKQRWAAARWGTLQTVPLERQQVLGEVALLCDPTQGARPRA